MTDIPVMEIFGPTIQGEGMVIGQKTMFVRTAGCDYSCSWCDSSFTWDGSGKEMIRQMAPEEIWNELKAIGGNRFDHVTVSGGNPALLKNLEGLVRLLKKNEIEIGLETQGSRWQDWMLEVDQLTISPKPPSSGMVPDLEMLAQIIERLSGPGYQGSISLKVVIFSEEDYEFARSLHRKFPGLPFFLQVGNADIHTADNEVLARKLLMQYEELINRVIDDEELNRVKVLPQLHTLLWGNKRGE